MREAFQFFLPLLIPQQNGNVFCFSCFPAFLEKQLGKLGKTLFDRNDPYWGILLFSLGEGIGRAPRPAADDPGFEWSLWASAWPTQAPKRAKV